MEAEKIIEKKIYEENGHDMDRVERKARNGWGMGLAGVLTGGAALLNQWGNGRGLFGGGIFGGNSMPENININTLGGSAQSGAPTPFQSWEKACHAQLNLTNDMWGLKMNTLTQMYDHRQTDIAEKFSIWKSQADSDFGLYKSMRDGFDAIGKKQNEDAFGLYKNQRDNFDVLSARIGQLEKEVAVNSAIRPYQDKLIQCEIEKAYTASVNHTDRLDCRNIKGIVTLPNTPTVTGFPTSCGCNSNYGTTTTTA